MNPVQIILTTCPRLHSTDPYEYFRATLEKLYAQFEDGMSLTVVDDRDRSGSIVSFKKALAQTIPGHDVLWLQDDISFCKNAVKTMIACQIPADEGYVSFLDFYHFRDEVRRVGLHSVPALLGLRSLGAVKFSCEAIAVLKDKFSTYERRPHEIDHDDVLVSSLLRDRFPFFSICLPNIVQHVGRFSSHTYKGKPYDNDRGRFYSQNYPGDDFDASTLPLS